MTKLDKGSSTFGRIFATLSILRYDFTLLFDKYQNPSFWKVLCVVRVILNNGSANTNFSKSQFVTFVWYSRNWTKKKEQKPIESGLQCCLLVPNPWIRRTFVKRNRRQYLAVHQQFRWELKENETAAVRYILMYREYFSASIV